MPTGRERNILRWELHAYLIEQQIAQIDEQLAQQRDALAPADEAQAAQRARLEQARITLQKQLDALGPSPKAKMG